MSPSSSSSRQKPSHETIHEALRGWPALHSYVLPDDDRVPSASATAAEPAR